MYTPEVPWLWRSFVTKWYSNGVTRLLHNVIQPSELQQSPQMFKLKLCPWLHGFYSSHRKIADIGPEESLLKWGIPYQLKLFSSALFYKHRSSSGTLGHICPSCQPHDCTTDMRIQQDVTLVRPPNMTTNFFLNHCSLPAILDNAGHLRYY